MFGLSTEDHREARKAAMRHYGRKYAFYIVFGPIIAKAILWAGLVTLAYITWETVPHGVLGLVALLVAGGSALALLWPKLARLGSRRRLTRRAEGATVQAPRLQLGWAYATLLIVGAGMGWLALWSPFA